MVADIRESMDRLPPAARSGALLKDLLTPELKRQAEKIESKLGTWHALDLIYSVGPDASIGANATLKTLRQRVGAFEKQEAAAERAERFQQLVPFLALLAEYKRQNDPLKRVSERGLFKQAHKELKEVDLAGDLATEVEARRIKNSGIFPKWPPSQNAIRDVCKDFTLEQMTDVRMLPPDIADDDLA